MKKPQLVNVHEAKTHLSRLLAKVTKGNEVVIAKGNTPIARLIPYRVKTKKRPLGLYRGKIQIAADFDDLPKEILEAFHGKNP